MMFGSAVFSQERPPLFRLRLDRWWDEQKPRALVCMGNPSRAGMDNNDQTIHALVRLLRPLPEIGGFTVMNAETYIATDPADLLIWQMEMDTFALRDLRFENLTMITELSKAAPIRIVAWGNLLRDAPPLHVKNLVNAVACYGLKDLYCFGTTKGGNPKHPLARGKSRIADGTRPSIWRKKG